MYEWLVNVMVSVLGYYAETQYNGRQVFLRLGIASVQQCPGSCALRSLACTLRGALVLSSAWSLALWVAVA
jgi:hypothetical protein